MLLRPLHLFTAILGLTLSSYSLDSRLASELTSQFEAERTPAAEVTDTGALSIHLSGLGSVASTDRQQTIFCQATCEHFLLSGVSVTLIATPQPGYHFAGWSGACSGLGACNITVDAAQTVSASFAPGAGLASDLHFVPAAPCRIADTRNPNGPFGGPFLGAQTVRGFTISSSACNIPVAAQAFSLNITVVPHSKLGFLTTFPCGVTQPLVSTLNSDGRVKAVAAIVPAGANGDVCFFVTDDTELVLDIDGYFVPDPAGLDFYPVTPCRLVDTRLTAGPLGGPALVGHAVRTFPLLASPCNLPATAQAYSLNFTSVPRGTLGFLTTWPAGQTQPLVSTLNAITGAVTANAAIVPAGTNGDVSVFVTDSSDLVIDVNGYFAPPDVGGLSLFNLSPCRVADTRNPPGTPPFNGAVNVNVVASPCGVSPTAQSFVLNATVVPPASLGFLTLWPQGGTQPLVSTLNAIDSAVTSNMAIVPTTNGSVSAFGANPTHLVLDISAYFAPPITPPPPPVTVSISPTSVTLAAGAPQLFTATVTNTTNTAVTWKVNGIVGGNSTFGFIDTTGNYTAPAAPATVPISVTAVSQANPAKSASAAVTVTFSNASLGGDFVFLVTVGDTNPSLGSAPGFSFAAGRFHADGQGNLTAGVEDVNTLNQGLATNVSFTGSYTIGSDGRGAATLTTLSGSTPLRFVLTSGDRGQVIEFDGIFAASGFVQRQDPAAIAGVSGTYVFSLFGDSAGQPLGIIGRLTADGAGNLSGSEIVNSQGTETQASIAGTYTIGPGGRGLATVTSALATQHFAFYIVNAGTVQFIDIDPPTVSGRAAGTLYQQANIGFSNASLGSSAFFLNGIFVQGGVFTAAGRFSTDGAGTLTGVADIHSSVSQSGAAINGTYTVNGDGAGRLNFGLTGPASSGFEFWMISADQAVMLQRGTIPASQSTVSTGLLFRQQAGAFTAAQFQGNYGFSVAQVNQFGAQAVSGQITADGIGALTGTEDISIPPSADQPVTGTWSIGTNGRGSGSVIVGTGGFATTSTLVFYPISPAEIIFMTGGAVGLAEKQCSDCH